MKVTVYTTDNCLYCSRAKALLEANGVPFREVKVDRDDGNARVELEKRSGMKTFPQIFFGEDIIGGYQQLKELAEREGLGHLI